MRYLRLFRMSPPHMSSPHEGACLSDAHDSWRTEELVLPDHLSPVPWRSAEGGPAGWAPRDSLRNEVTPKRLRVPCPWHSARAG